MKRVLRKMTWIHRVAQQLPVVYVPWPTAHTAVAVLAVRAVRMLLAER